jgi:hypothetical protein
MKATVAWAAPLAGLLLAASSAQAQYYSPVTKQPLGYAPDAYGPGYYVMCPDGQIIGPNYWLRPCFEPFQGVRPTVTPVRSMGPNGPTWQFQTNGPQRPQQNGDLFRYNPFVRSPRDFFMFRENMEELARTTRPALIP